MRGFIPLLLALSASYTTVAALPQPRVVVREPADKPKYSVVPLEPGDDEGSDPGDSGSGDDESDDKGKGDDHGDDDGDGVVTVIETVVKTREPVTHVVTKTGKPDTVTAPAKTVTKAIPTTVSVIDLEEGQVTRTITVVPQPSVPKSKAPKKPSPTEKAETTITLATGDLTETTSQPSSAILSSAAAPEATSEPQPQPEPESPTIAEPSESTGDLSSTTTESGLETTITIGGSQEPIIGTFSTTSDSASVATLETVVEPPPAVSSSIPRPDSTTLVTLTSHAAAAPEETTEPSAIAPVEPSGPSETTLDIVAPEPTATVPFIAPIAPTTFITSAIITPGISSKVSEPIPPPRTYDDGSWRSTYPAWNGTVLSV
ncbi:hypothetical protein ACJ41O_002608 [Fusarium nematophilum]